jgi:hypothetical protein
MRKIRRGGSARLAASEEFLTASISFSQFDSYDKKFPHLEDQLEKILWSFSSITDKNADLARNIEQVIEG